MPTGDAAVGWRLAVFWPDEDAWFEGVVVESHARKGLFVLYDDGDRAWVSPGTDLRWLQEPADADPFASDDDDDDDDDDLPEAGTETVASPRAMLPPASFSPRGAGPASPLTSGDELDSSSGDDSDARDEREREALLNLSVSRGSPPRRQRRQRDFEDHAAVDPDVAALKQEHRQQRRWLAEEEEEQQQQQQQGADGEGGEGTSRAAFLDLIRTKTEHVAAQPPAFAAGETISAGDGVLSGKVFGAKGLRLGDRHTGAFAKVSFVQPGPGAILFRCKVTVHETDGVRAGPDCAWSNGAFSFEVADPGDWTECLGDLLFAVYAVQGVGDGSRGEFVGQALVSMESLLDGTPLSRHGGRQVMFDKWVPLAPRAGGEADLGTVHVSLQLTLPPGVVDEGAAAMRREHYLAEQQLKAMTDWEEQQLMEGGAPGIMLVEAPSQPAARAAGTRARTKPKPKKHKPRSRAQQAREAKEHIRRRQQEKIQRENEIHAQRIRDVQVRSKKLAPRAQPKVKLCGDGVAAHARKIFEARVAKENEILSQRMKERVGMTGPPKLPEEVTRHAIKEVKKGERRAAREQGREDADFRAHSRLAEEVGRLSTAKHELEAEVQLLRTKITRLGASVQRNQRAVADLESGKKTEFKGGATQAAPPRAKLNLGGPLAKLAGAESKGTGRKRSAAGGAKVDSRTVARERLRVEELERTHDALQANRKNAVEDVRRNRLKVDELKAQVGAATEQLEHVARRKQWLSASGEGRREMAAADSAEQQLLDDAQLAIREAKIDIQANRDALEHGSTTDERRETAAKQRNDQLRAKLEAKRAKLRTLQHSRDALKDRAEAAIRDGRSFELRSEIADLQHALAACVRAEGARQRAEAAARVQVTHSRRQFEAKLAADKDEFDEMYVDPVLSSS